MGFITVQDMELAKLKEVDIMSFITLGGSNEILTITISDPGGGIEITDEQQFVIANSRFGHIVYDYIAGELVLNQERYNAKILPILLDKLHVFEQSKIDEVVPPHEIWEFLSFAIFVVNNKVDGTATAEQLTRLDNIISGGILINQIRNAADTIEQELIVSADPESINIYTHVAWPA